MAAVGESDPTFSHLQDALKKAKAQCKCARWRIALTKEFFARAKKRIVACSTEVSQAQEALAKVQSKLQFEEQGLVDGKARLAALIQESAEAVEEVPATLPANFAHELAELRACLSDLRQENSDSLCTVQVRSRRRRARTQTSQKFGNVLSRVGPPEPCRSRVWSWGGAKRAIDGGCFTQNGDSHLQRRSKFAFESIQSLVSVIRQAGYGLRGSSSGGGIPPSPESSGVMTTQVDPILPAGTNEISLTERDVLTDSCSDTESCCSQIDADPRTRSRRLRLVWDPSVQPRVEHSNSGIEKPEMEGLFRTLGGRVGVLPEGAPYPRAIKQQRWSPVNVNSGIGLDDPCMPGNSGACGVP